MIYIPSPWRNDITCEDPLAGSSRGCEIQVSTLDEVSAVDSGGNVVLEGREEYGGYTTSVRGVALPKGLADTVVGGHGLSEEEPCVIDG
jgi:hypothetical protein